MLSCCYKGLQVMDQFLLENSLRTLLTTDVRPMGLNQSGSDALLPINVVLH